MCHMDQKFEIHYVPAFDYSEYLNSSELSDCSLILPDGTIIKAHVLVLANSSNSFFNFFTSGMSEDTQRKVNIDENPDNCFPDVVNFMYSGNININLSNVMPIYQIAEFYQIETLRTLLIDYLNQHVNKETLFELINQCFDKQLEISLQYLAHYIKNYLDLPELSSILDAKTYISALILNDSLTENQKLILFERFIGDYQLTDDDKTKITKELERDPALKSVIKHKHSDWIV